jgi:hypothetical protein
MAALEDQVQVQGQVQRQGQGQGQGPHKAVYGSQQEAGHGWPSRAMAALGDGTPSCSFVGLPYNTTSTGHQCNNVTVRDRARAGVCRGPGLPLALAVCSVAWYRGACVAVGGAALCVPTSGIPFALPCASLVGRSGARPPLPPPLSRPVVVPCIVLAPCMPRAPLHHCRCLAPSTTSSWRFKS